MTSLLSVLLVICCRWDLYLKPHPGVLKPSFISLVALCLLVCFKQSIAAPWSTKQLTTPVGFNATGTHAAEANGSSNPELTSTHHPNLNKTQGTPLDTSQSNKPGRHFSTSGSLHETNLLRVGITRDPNDLYPPFDLRIQIDVQYMGSSELTWRSTELTFPLKKTKAIGGSSTCTNRPNPALKLNPVNTKLSYRLRSSNTYKMDFDWRLFEGRHQPLLRLFTGQNCRGKDLFHSTTLEFEFTP